MKKTPMRRCLATNESFPKKDLLRIVRTPKYPKLEENSLPDPADCFSISRSSSSHAFGRSVRSGENRT
ncbi:MAG: DUF448 domain-containing protein, partial [Erysipelotrichaceae bacterium]|nr:DUF448 domain-containing protein [Erysipelotrichaceae bacterium]